MRRLVVLIALCASPAFAQTPARVASPAGPAVVAGALRAEAVALDLARLDAAAKARTPVALALFGADVAVTPDRVDRRGAGRYTVAGRVAGGGRALFTVVDGRMIGQVITPRGTVRIEPRGDAHVAFVPGPLPESPDDWRDPPPRTGSSRGSGGSDALFPDELHVALFYTGAVVDSLGPDLDVTLQATVDALADVFANSAVPMTARMVVSREVDYEESGTMSTDLYAFQDAFDGQMDEVHAVRDAHGADVMALLTETGSNSATGCGIAFLMTQLSVDFEDAAFGVTKRRCGGLVFAHEVGHNIGLHHDRYVTSGQGTFPYAYGFTNTDSLDAPAGRPGFRTVLAYNTACQDLGGTCDRIPFYSDPDSLWFGQPMGAEGTEDNARAAQQSVPFVTAWRVAEARATGSSTTAGAPTFARPICADPEDVSSCTVAAGPTAYAGQSLRVLSDGLYYVQGAPDFDGVLLLYAGAFDPSAPLDGLVGYAEADEAAPVQRRWLVRADLTDGVDYVLVTTGRAAADAGAFSHTIYGPDAVQLIVADEASPAGASSVTLSVPQPNPAAGTARLTLSVATAQTVRATLVDALGRTVATLFDGPVESGGTREIVVGDVAPGVYSVVVRGEAASATRQVTVLR